MCVDFGKVATNFLSAEIRAVESVMALAFSHSSFSTGFFKAEAVAFGFVSAVAVLVPGFLAAGLGFVVWEKVAVRSRPRSRMLAKNFIRIFACFKIIPRNCLFT